MRHERQVPCCIAAGMMLAATVLAGSAPAATVRSVSADGEVSLRDLTAPLSPLLTEGGKQVLLRTRATEGPGAPVPLPAEAQDMAELRRLYDQNLQPNVEHMRAAFPVDLEESSIDGISVVTITPKGGVPAGNRGRLMLNGPGGGFRTGVRANGLLISIPVAAILKVKVVSILYRQGPEYQFPAASEDLLKVWNHYVRFYKPKNIGMVGCSAGGSLISQTTAMLIKAGRPTPGVLGVYCAGLGANFAGDSQVFSQLAVTNVRAAIAASAAAGPAGRNYYTGVDMNQFIVNPTLDDALLARFPPTVFFTATRDMAMSPAAFSYRKLRRLHIDSELLVYDGLYHGFMTNPDFPEAQEGYRLAAAFFDQHLGR